MRELILISGCHRSGTSLIAQILAKNGRNFGKTLISESFSNSNGHLEDKNIVDIHDAIFEANGVDWTQSESKKLLIPSKIEAQFNETLQLKRNTQYIDAIKDPRALCFSQLWLKQPNLKFIVVFRKWEWVVSSLLKRHSFEALISPSRIEAQRIHTRFWQDTALAVKLWSYYAELSLNLKKHHSNVALISLDDFLEGSTNYRSELMQIGLQPELLDTQSVEGSLLQKFISPAMLEMIPQAWQEKATRLHQELRAVSNENRPIISLKTAELSILSETITKKIESELTAITPDSVIRDYNCRSKTDDWKLIDQDNLVKKLQKLNSIDEEVFSTIVYRNDISYENLIAIANVAIEKRSLASAERIAHNLLEQKKDKWPYVLLGSIYLTKKDPLTAKTAILSAFPEMAEHPVVLIKLAQVEMQLGKYNEAEKYLEQAESVAPTRPVISKLKSILNNMRSHQEVKSEKSTRTNLLNPLDHAKIIDLSLSENMNYTTLVNEQFKLMSLLRDENWLHGVRKSMSKEGFACFVVNICEHYEKAWPIETLENLFRVSLPSFPHDLDNATREEASIAVWIHVYYPEILNEIMAYIGRIPSEINLYLTTPKSILNETLSHPIAKSAMVIPCENRGRDILPWLQHANKHTAKHELVLKIHTKKSPHEQSKIKNWMTLLLWQLVGDKNEVRRNLQAFQKNPRLGLLMSNYHPGLKDSITWGKNYTIATELANMFGITITEDNVQDFPAGSMFWYRPRALTELLDMHWESQEFPNESGQIDGTIMHGIERLLPYFCEKQQFGIQFVENSLKTRQL